MFNLYYLIETFAGSLPYITLVLLSFLSILSGVFVIISKNPILSVLFLISLFTSISVYLMTLGLNFIGVSYLLVYVGAISILFLFILMLINVRVSELVTDNYNSIALAILIGIIYSTDLYEVLPSNFFSIIFFMFFNNALFVTSYTWDGTLTEFSHIMSIGNILYTVYPIWLIITSLILLLAMVGSIVITIRV